MRTVWAALFALVCSGGCFAASDDTQFNGRWDIAVNGEPSRARAWWLEVTGAGADVLKGRFVGAPGGQLEDISKISILDGELRFVFERRYRREVRIPQRGLYWAHLDGGKLKGTFEIEGDPTTYLEWTGVKAPAIPDKDDGTWKRGEPVQLFNGKDLAGWQGIPAGKQHNWNVKDGILLNSPISIDLASEKKYWNFDLHVEYQLAPRGNSGIGLRGRYEVQLLDDYGEAPSKQSHGGIYGRIAPKVNASKLPGEWQTLDLRLIGRQVSVTLNSVKVIDKAIIEGLTSIAQDPNEGEPGPLILQGDRGLVQFRKVTLYPLTSSPAPSTTPLPPALPKPR